MRTRFFDLFKTKSAGIELSIESAACLMRARGLQEMGRLAEAAAEYRAILALHPEHLDSLYALGSLASQAGDFDSAVHLYSEVIKRRRNHADAFYKRANALNALGLWDRAVADFDLAVKIDPQHAHAFCNRGAVLEHLHRWDEALRSYDKALELDPNDALTHFNRAAVLIQLKEFDAALTSYGRAIASRPGYADAYINRGNMQRELRRFEDAVESYDGALQLLTGGRALRLAYHGRGLALAELTKYEESLASFDGALQQKDADDHLLHAGRGMALRRLQRWEDALAAFQRALALKADYAEVHFYRGQILHELRRYDEALSSFDKAIECTPAGLSPYLAHGARGFALAASKRLDEAVLSFRQAVDIKSDYIEAHYAGGHALHELGRYEESVACYDAIIAIDPGLQAFPAYRSKAFVLKDLKRLTEAVASYDRAIELKSDDPEVHLNRGLILQELGRHQDAIPSFEQAILLKSDLGAAFHGHGFSLFNRGFHDLAIASFDQAITVDPHPKYVFGFRRYVKMHACAWDGLEGYLEQLETDLRGRRPVSAPLQVLALVDSPLLHQLAAEIWVAEEFPPDDGLGALPGRNASGKIRVGYFSSDFRIHPVALLTANLFASHDRSKFEIIAFAFGPKVHDALRARLESAFDQFIDVSEQSDREVAEIARRLELDIAVDLGGFTEFARPKVFAMRAAPVQMSYIGYLGTMGAPYMDYLLADPVTIPTEEQKYYSEKIIYLPCYQVNDSTRATVKRALTRADLGLPATGFLYSSFNATYKITPATFGLWMRILARVEGSHLYLYAGNEAAERNLRKEAAVRGVDSGRIIFGKYLAPVDYLARFCAMDLFLDTLPYNAGTTASDALWAGLPVLTQAGRGFAARVGASLLTAIGLPELIASTAEEYEETAVRLASDPQQLQEIKRKLARNRLTSALFDTRSFTRNLEAAYVRVHERQRSGLPPETLVVAPGNT